MGTASALIDTAVAESPVTFITIAAFPKAIIGRRMANVAKKARYQTTRRVVIRDLPFTTNHYLCVL